MIDKILTICKPTYNRKNVIIPDVESYMAIQDERFVVKINDNASTDGTAEGLQYLKERYPDRIILGSFPKNLGGVKNGNAVLKNVETPYILYLLDKDTIDCKLLSKFINLLIEETPYFGFVNLQPESGIAIKTYKVGFDSSTKIGFRNGHPSGFFFRTDLLNAEFKKKYYLDTNDSFDFALDMIQGIMGLQYPGTMIDMPLVIDASKRVDNTNNGKTYSYNEDNIYFGFNARANAYKYYLTALIEHKNNPDALKVIKYITIKYCIIVSIGMRRFYSDEVTCNHYNVVTRYVGYKEMLSNVLNILSIFRHNTIGVLTKFKINIYTLYSIIIYNLYYILKK